MVVGESDVGETVVGADVVGTDVVGANVEGVDVVGEGLSFEVGVHGAGSQGVNSVHDFRREDDNIEVV